MSSGSWVRSARGRPRSPSAREGIRGSNALLDKVADPGVAGAGGRDEDRAVHVGEPERLGVDPHTLHEMLGALLLHLVLHTPSVSLPGAGGETGGRLTSSWMASTSIPAPMPPATTIGLGVTTCTRWIACAPAARFAAAQRSAPVAAGDGSTSTRHGGMAAGPGPGAGGGLVLGPAGRPRTARPPGFPRPALLGAGPQAHALPSSWLLSTNVDDDGRGTVSDGPRSPRLGGSAPARPRKSPKTNNGSCTPSTGVHSTERGSRTGGRPRSPGRSTAPRKGATGAGAGSAPGRGRAKRAPATPVRWREWTSLHARWRLPSVRRSVP